MTQTIRRTVSRSVLMRECAAGGLSKYHARFLEHLHRKINLHGKTVLEIGGHTFPRKILFELLGAAKWVSVDFTDYWGDHLPLLESAKTSEEFAVFKLDQAADNFNAHSYLKFDGDAALIPETFNGQFDAAVSLACFEHVQDLETVVGKIYTSLKTGGQFYTSFSPIWSAVNGHHYYFRNDISHAQWKRDKIPPWLHLRWSEEEARTYFAEHPLPFGEEQLEALMQGCYHRETVNRRFFEDYETVMQKSPFKHYNIRPFGNIWRKITCRQILALLRKKYPGYQQFTHNGMQILAVK